MTAAPPGRAGAGRKPLGAKIGLPGRIQSALVGQLGAYFLPIRTNGPGAFRTLVFRKPPHIVPNPGRGSCPPSSSTALADRKPGGKLARPVCWVG